ncbi:MAG: DUF433 domain-containing protein [Burkholderiales bacterium]|nr:DUF433 domain-containing protein [Burkholderiales bacterium]
MASKERKAFHDDPAYSAGEAARMLALPAGTVKAWSFGHDYRHRDGSPKRFVKLIDVADTEHRLLSFANVCELHVLAALRRNHRVSMPTVRDSLDYVSRELALPRPLIARAFLTDGVSLFVEHASMLLNTSQGGQMALRGDFEKALARIEYSRAGMPVRLFPFTRTSWSLADQPQAVVIDPRLAFGRPALVRGGVTTAVVEDRFRAGDSPAEMAEDYRVDESDIWEAIRFEQRLVA